MGWHQFVRLGVLVTMFLSVLISPGTSRAALPLVPSDPNNYTALRIQVEVSDPTTTIIAFDETLYVRDGGTGSLDSQEIGIIQPAIRINDLAIDFGGGHSFETTIGFDEIPASLTIDEASFLIQSTTSTGLAEAIIGDPTVIASDQMNNLLKGSVTIGTASLPFDLYPGTTTCERCVIGDATSDPAIFPYTINSVAFGGWPVSRDVDKPIGDIVIEGRSRELGDAERLTVTIIAQPTIRNARFSVTAVPAVTEVMSGLISPERLAIDASGNLFVVSFNSVFKRSTSGAIETVITDDGDGMGNFLQQAECLAVDSEGNVYVCGAVSHNAFQITPGGEITEIIDETGDNIGNTLRCPRDIAVDDQGNVYVVGACSVNVFEIGESDIVEIVDESGDGIGNTLAGPEEVALDRDGNVFVSGNGSFNVFRIAPSGEVEEIFMANQRVHGLAVSRDGNAYVGSEANLFEITPTGEISQIFDSFADGKNEIDAVLDVAVADRGNVYLTGADSDNAFEITPSGVITEIIDGRGDGSGENVLDRARQIAVDAVGNVYVSGNQSGNVFKITFIPEPSPQFLQVSGIATLGLLAVYRRRCRK